MESAPSMRGDGGGQAFEAADAVALAAELGVEGDGIERGHAGVEAAGAVEVPEMAGVAEAGAQHAFVARDDGRTAVRGGDIGGEGETGGGGAVRAGAGRSSAG